MIYDISPAIRPDLAVWPGDTQPSREVLMDIARGDNLTLSTLRTTVHVGAHADAPSHYGPGAATIDERELELFVGPCQVVHVRPERAPRIASTMIGDAIRQPRLLIATHSYPDPYLPLVEDGRSKDAGSERECTPRQMRSDFCGLEPDLIDSLASQGVKLIGVDTPSVDTFDCRELRAHARCLAHDIQIVEGLILAEVPAGDYELIALPLKLTGFDASPVRAILRPLP